MFRDMILAITHVEVIIIIQKHKENTMETFCELCNSASNFGKGFNETEINIPRLIFRQATWAYTRIAKAEVYYNIIVLLKI